MGLCDAQSTQRDPLLDHGNKFPLMFGILMMIEATRLPRKIMEGMRLVFVHCAAKSTPPCFAVNVLSTPPPPNCPTLPPGWLHDDTIFLSDHNSVMLPIRDVASPHLGPSPRTLSRRVLRRQNLSAVTT